MIRVAIVDDHPIVREGLVATFAGLDDFLVAGVAATASDARELVARERPDIVVLDLEMPDATGLDAIPALLEVSSTSRIVVFSAHAGEERVERALALGAHSYVLKGTPSDELVAILRAVARGERPLPADISAQLVRLLRAPRRTRVTEREREILSMLAGGLANKTIAERLQISERTVKFHVAEIYGRLGAQNRVQAVTLARNLGLL